LTVFLNLFAIKAKPSVGSLPLMLNLLWDDRHLRHIKKNENIKNWFALAILSAKLLQAPVSKNIVE
jgi:hypothetical protein